MRKQEKISIVQYLYNMEERLTSALTDCNYRFVRRDLDSVDLLENIIALENLKLFHQITGDIIRILSLNDDD